MLFRSSDATELAGLCDRVVVMSRGQAVAELVGEDVTEEQIVSHAVTSTATVVEEAARTRARAPRWRRLVEGDHAPTLLLLAVMVALAAVITPGNDRYLSSFNIYTVLTAATATGFIALGQTVALLMRGIDLSVGPLAGFLVVVASFYAGDGAGTGDLLTGLGLMLLAAVLTGLVNATLIRAGRFTAIAATLTTYIALGGLAFLLRPTQGGFISLDLQNRINYVYGAIPAVFLLLLGLAVLLEYGLRRRHWGWRLRAVGSDEDAARRLGVPVTRTVVLGYVLASLLTLLGAVVLMGQYGVGDPSQIGRAHV